MFREQDRKRCEELYQKYYAGRKFIRTLYRELIQKNLSEGQRVLDAGCGRYLELSRELPESVHAVGVDLEKTLDTRNQFSPYGLRGNLECLPFPSGCFDLVISRSVVEHLSDPRSVFREFYRVLKPGGRVILSTPNKYDYVSLIASLTPYRWHRMMVSRIVGVGEDDVFPTLYRANTLTALARELTEAGFSKKELEAVNHYPVYLMFSPVLFRLGVWYERLTSLSSLRFLRGSLLCVFEKPAARVSVPAGTSNVRGAERVSSLVDSLQGE